MQNLFEHLVKLPLDEETSMSNISFTPSHIGNVKASILKLGVEDLNVEIRDGSLFKNVTFNKQLRVRVPRRHFDSFNKLFNPKLEHGSVARLVVNEVRDTKMLSTIINVRTAINNIVRQQDVLKTINSVVAGLSVFRKHQHINNSKAAINFSTIKSDLAKITKDVLDEYRDDLGFLEILLEKLKQEESLNDMSGFDKYELLFSANVKLEYGKVVLLQNNSVGFNYDIDSYITITDKDLLEKLSSNNSYSISGNKLRPKNKLFTKAIYLDIQDNIEGLVDET